MTNKEILEKAINKAIDNGWVIPKTNMEKVRQSIAWFLVDEGASVMDVIFNHDFAKALWGETTWDELPDKIDGIWKWEKYPLEEDGHWTSYCENYGFCEPMWKYHLQQMVISEDPIKYLGENI